MPKINISKTLLNLGFEPNFMGQLPNTHTSLDTLGLLYSCYNLLSFAYNILYDKFFKFSQI
jgi:hypothetical protein